MLLTEVGVDIGEVSCCLLQSIGAQSCSEAKLWLVGIPTKQIKIRKGEKGKGPGRFLLLCSSSSELLYLREWRLLVFSSGSEEKIVSQWDWVVEAGRRT